MTYQSNRLKYLFLFAICVLLLFSCIFSSLKPAAAESLLGMGKLEGYVMDAASSDPLKNTVITVMERTVKSDSTGHFSIAGLLPGRVIIDAKLKDYDNFLTTITIEKGDNSYNIKLKPNKGQISKNVAKTPSENLARLKKSMEKSTATAAVPSNSSSAQKSALAAAGKSTETTLSSLPPVTAPASTVQRTFIPRQQTLLNSKLSIGVSGIVLDSMTNTPISRAKVFIDGNTYFTDVNGEFTSRPVEKSQIFVRSEATNHTAYESNVNLTSGNNKLKILLIPEEPNLISQGGINKNSIVEYTRFNQSYAKVFGYIKNTKNRQPIADATVVIGTQTTKTNKDGYYNIEGLPLGFVNISVLSNKYGIYKGKLNIVNVNNKYDIALTEEERRGTLIGIVNEKETGTPIYGAKIQVADKIVVSDKFGSFTINDLPFDYYNIIVEQGGYQRVERAISINEEKVNINISLADDYTSDKTQKN